MNADERAARVEQIKLTATTINTVGIAILISGAVLPVISLLYGGAPPKARLAWAVGLWWVACSAALHTFARAVLGRISNDQP